MRVYAAGQVHAALPWPALVEALAQGFAAGANVPPRHVHTLGAGPSGTDTLLLMPAWNERVLGHKIVTVLPGNPAQGRPAVGASYLLLDRRSGEPLALLDGEALTLRRTAAVSALAARQLAREDTSRLLVVGAGRLAPWMLRAHVAMRPALREVAVWARDADAAQALVDAVAPALAEDLPSRTPPTLGVATDLAAAVRRAHMVCCATSSTEPLVQGADLRPGTHLDLVGGFRPEMREVDDDAVAAAQVIVVDTRAGAAAEAGDLVQPMQCGRVGVGALRGELAELLRGEIVGRRSADEVTLFKSVGTALADLAAAQAVVGAG